MRFSYTTVFFLLFGLIAGCATTQTPTITIGDVKNSISAYEGAELTLRGRVGTPLNFPKSNAQIFRLSHGKESIWVFKKSGERRNEGDEVDVTGRVKAGFEFAGQHYGSTLIGNKIVKISP
ncbi:hypothetical protein ACFL1X_00290 [Candidatus Hydrogenedentota bacterium]